MTDQLRRSNANTKRNLVLAVLFTVSFLAVEMALLDYGDQQLRGLPSAFAKYGFGKGMLSAFASVVSVLVTFLFVVSAFSARAYLKPLYFVIFSLAAAIEFSVHRAFRRFSTLFHAEIALWAADARFILDAFEMYFEPAALVPIAIFLLGLLITRHSLITNPTLAATITLGLMFFSATAFFSSNTYPTVSFSAAFRTAVSIPTIWWIGTSQTSARSVHYLPPRETLDFRSNERATNNVVFIMDESVRGDYLSVNGHPNPTSPTLERVNENGMMRNWGIASSATTCSVSSNNLILSGVTQVPDTSAAVFRQPTIFQFAKAMNYKTHMIDAQTSGVWLGKPADYRYVDEWTHARELGVASNETFRADEAAAQRIREIVSTSKGNFIWVNKFGVHRPYADSRPPPDNNNEAARDRHASTTDNARGTLKREYEESLRYNSESFFATLLSPGPAEDTLYVYTSDHGQTLGEEDVERASHCVADRTAAIVPMLLIAPSDRLPKVDTEYRASHSNVFPTLLELMGVPDKHRTGYALSLLVARRDDSVPRYFFSGDLYRDEGVYPFDQDQNR